ncbi:phosphotransferase family protein [Actinoallomurus vinaceus]|uniref:Phosphotransferase family protein n=1 Tax=Actinoallomurus vinaceus TaxID=1080074 RepID=A0ABP8UJ69_9ACTN
MTEQVTGVPGIDVPRLSSWLADNLSSGGPITGIELLAGGRSNLTYLIRLGDRRVVLRRPPLGHVLPTAHDMRREHTVLSALAGTDVPVPTPLALCLDEDVIGAPFYLMEHVDGRVLRTVEDAADVTPEEARTLSERLADAFAAIHTLDVEKAGLAGFGRPQGYMTRQLARWRKQWDASIPADATLADATRASYDRLVERLTTRLPGDGLTGLVHGDFRLDNALVRLRPKPEIAAVVDWEMSTLGDPLSDLGLTLVYWTDPGDDERGSIPVGSTVTTAPGFLSSGEFAERYAATTGYDLTDLDFYVAFGCFKLAVVLEGIHVRYLQKATVGEGFEGIGASVPILLDRAHRTLDDGTR